jgi:alternate signal-mediated exported protein
MKRFKNITLSNRRKLAIAGVGLAVLAIGGTIAYNQTASIFSNNFKLATDEIEAIDVVPIERNTAQPCEEYPKTAVVKNKNNDSRYVRMKINTYWRVENTAQTDHETSDLPMTWTDGSGTHEYAYYLTQNDDKWNLNNDGWYYYYQPLAGGATTESLLKSAMFNCDANFGGETSYSQDGLVAETIVSPYSNAEFHIYVTFQISDEPMISRTRLYDLVASKTSGVDSSVDFSQTATASTGNGNGVNTLAAHKDDDKPVYYYRGEVSDNNVLFNNQCWKMVRTTGTGGVKMVYAGTPNEENGAMVCSNVGISTELEDLTHYVDPQDESDSWLDGCWVGYRYKTSPGIVGYMFNRRYLYICTEHRTSSEDNIVVGNDVEYVNGHYELRNTSSGKIYEVINDFYNNKHYYCQDGSASCENVLYSVEITSYQSGSDWVFSSKSVEFTNGGKIDDENGVYANDYDSEAKKTVETWFGNNMASVEDKLEDTVYCDDRTVYNQALGSKDAGVSRANNDWAWYGPGYRVVRVNQPSVDCPNKRDSFTKQESATGNGKLTYKVGLMTADELSLAGILYGTNADTNYLSMPHDQTGEHRWSDSWTMSQVYNVIDENNVIYTIYWSQSMGGNNCGSRGCGDYRVRPVISIIYDTYVADGDGTASNPYTLEW